MISNLKVSIINPLKNKPWGGGNQFLRALRQELQIKAVYVDVPANADIIVSDSYQSILPALRLKKSFPDKLLVMRLGPIFHLHRGSRWRRLDKILSQIANRADWVVFQSNWSYQKYRQLGFINDRFSIIHNAPDPTIFYPADSLSTTPLSTNQKTKLIAASWSSNPKKGFSFYQYLDHHLNWNKYAMIFIGSTPVKFKNISILPPQTSPHLATHLRNSDIFISATMDDACPNTVGEALACGLPVLGLKSGGLPEIISSGELFSTPPELLTKLSLIKNYLGFYRSHISPPNLSRVTDLYISSFHQAVARGPRSLPLLFSAQLTAKISLFNLLRRL